MRSWRAAGVLAVGLVLGASAVALGVDPPAQYTGCLTKDGVLYKVNVGTTPKQACSKNETLITWNQQGPQGLQGSTGPSGAPGTNGSDGAAGPAGAAVLNGAGAPTTQGADGDFYIDTAANMIYGPKASGSWPMTGVSLVGPQGPEGPAGKPGSDGSAAVLVEGIDVSSAPINRDFGTFDLSIGCSTGSPVVSWEGGSSAYAYRELGTTTGTSVTYTNGSMGNATLSATTPKVTFAIWYPGHTPATFSVWGTTCSNLVYTESPAVSTIRVPIVEYIVETMSTNGPLDLVEIANTASPTPPLGFCSDGVSWGCAVGVNEGTDVTVSMTHATAFQYTCPGSGVTESTLGDDGKQHGACATPSLDARYTVSVTLAEVPGYSVTVTISSTNVMKVEIDDETVDPWNPIVLKTCDPANAATGCNAVGIGEGRSISVVLLDESPFNFTCPGGTSQGAVYNLGTGLMTGYCSLGTLTSDKLVTVEPFI